VIVTRQSLAKDLRALGVRPNDILLVHTSLSALGHVIGGSRTVVEALLDVADTIMMPAYSGDLSDPAEWKHPPVDDVDAARDAIPAYDPRLTPTRGMGAIAEYFRTYPGVRRSPHPQSSFCALGPFAAALVDTHPLDFRFGPKSPLGALARLGGKVVLLGAPWNTCSFLYLGQSGEPVERQSPMIVGGVRKWVRYRDIAYTDAAFVDTIRALLQRGIAKQGRVGHAETIIFPCATAASAFSRPSTLPARTKSRSSSRR
jgi:aminoglycoside 3-N-acetyltransferase